MRTTDEYTTKANASIKTLYYKMRDKAQPLCEAFDTRYTAWRETWENPETNGKKELAYLIGMGVKVLPLVVHRLCDPSEARAVELYNAIEKNSDFKSQTTSIILESNHRRNQEFSWLSTSWKIYTESNMVGLQVALNCDEYENLIKLGPSVSANAMLMYYDDIAGWWDEVLCELLSGHPSGAQATYRSRTHRRWVDWFEKKDGDSTAPYKLVGVTARRERYLRSAGGGNPDAELDEQV